MEKRKKVKASRKRTSALATDLGLVVVSSLLSAATGYAAARDARGAMIGATGGAALPLAYRAVLTHDSSRRLGYGAASLAFLAVSMYLSWTRGIAGVTPAQIATSADAASQPVGSNTSGVGAFAGLGSAFGVGFN